MDNQIRRNEICVVGLPRCDFVFSSTRNCFIGYGFIEGALEMAILRNLLSERGIQAAEAGGTLAPGQNAFCAKICSKIITSQFCIILLNNEIKDELEIPNANVNMEYGLMLGFNKYIIPFQREGQKLPFNVAGLDTVKYTNDNFERKAREAIDPAVTATMQEFASAFMPHQDLEAFLLSKGLLLVPLTSEGDRNLYELGRPLGFNMVTSFDGMKYAYFGNFTTLRPEIVLWRLRTLENIIHQRIASIPGRIKIGIVKQEQADALMAIFEEFKTFLLVTSDEERKTLQKELAAKPSQRPVEVFALSDIAAALQANR